MEDHVEKERWRAAEEETDDHRTDDSICRTADRSLRGARMPSGTADRRCSNVMHRSSRATLPMSKQIAMFARPGRPRPSRAWRSRLTAGATGVRRCGRDAGQHAPMPLRPAEQRACGGRRVHPVPVPAAPTALRSRGGRALVAGLLPRAAASALDAATSRGRPVAVRCRRAHQRTRPSWWTAPAPAIA